MTRTNNFDGIRIIAASMVIYGHAYALTKTSGTPVIWQSGIHSLAIEIFFAISGYLVVKSFTYDPNFGRFLAKRALRIFPGLIVVTVIAACVLGPLITTLSLSDYFANPLFESYFKSITLKIHYSLPGVFENNIYPNAVNGSLWSLPVEFFMYLSVMLVGAGSLVALRKHRIGFEVLWTVFTLGLIVAFIGVIQMKVWDLSVSFFKFFYVPHALAVAPFFGVGGMIFIAERYTTRQIPVVVLIAVAVLLQVYQSPMLKILAFIFIPIIIIRVGQASWPVLRDLGRWGDLSYGTYLYGFPAGQVLAMYYLTTLPLFAHIVLALLISYVLAFGSWHLVEKRALRLKPKKAVDPAQQG